LTPRRIADELVKVIAVLVVAAVDDDAALALGAGGALVLDPTERAALDRLRRRVERIEFDHPAEVVEFIAIEGYVEARLGPVPVVSEPNIAHAVARFQRRRLPVRIVRAEVAVPVLLARQVGAPRRDAHRAVVQRAERRRGDARLQHRVIGPNRPGEPHRRRAGDATVARLAGYDIPLAVGSLLDRDHADAVPGERLGDFLAPGVVFGDH